MRPIHLFLFCVAVVPFVSCHKQDKEIEVRLFLVDKYVKMELTNHTHEDLYIPHMSSFITIWDEHGIEVSNAYLPNRRHASSLTDVYFDGKVPFKEFFDENHETQHWIYFKELMKKEKANFLKLNPSKTEEVIEEEYKSYMLSYEEFLRRFYVLAKCDGLAIKAGQTLTILEPTPRLFEKIGRTPKERLTIRFARQNVWEYSAFDTVQANGYRVFTRLPQMNAGYKLYDGAIECDDVIDLKQLR